MPKNERRERSRAAGKAKPAEVSRSKSNKCSRDEEETSFDDSDCKQHEPRQVASNWEKYRPKSPVVTADNSPEEASPGDFAELLTSSSDCNYFQFKSEKNWDSEMNSNFGCSKLFTLDVEFLASGLACIPFYERVGIDKSILSRADIERCDKQAEESVAQYELLLDKFLEKVKLSDALTDFEKTAATETREKGETEVAKESAIKSAVSTSPGTPDERQSPIPKCDSPKEEDDAGCCAKNLDPKVLDEDNLEDWLDSVLDD